MDFIKIEDSSYTGHDTTMLDVSKLPRRKTNFKPLLFWIPNGDNIEMYQNEIDRIAEKINYDKNQYFICKDSSPVDNFENLYAGMEWFIKQVREF